MTYSMHDSETAADAARALLEANIAERLEAVRNASNALARADETEAAFTAAAAEHQAAWKNALGVGWTDKELQSIGLRAPGKPAPKAPRERARRSSDRPSAPAPTADTAYDTQSEVAP